MTKLQIQNKLLAISELLSLATALEDGAYSSLFSNTAAELVDIHNELDKYKEVEHA